MPEMSIASASMIPLYDEMIWAYFHSESTPPCFPPAPRRSVYFQAQGTKPPMWTTAPAAQSYMDRMIARRTFTSVPGF